MLDTSPLTFSISSLISSTSELNPDIDSISLLTSSIFSSTSSLLYTSMSSRVVLDVILTPFIDGGLLTLSQSMSYLYSSSENLSLPLIVKLIFSDQHLLLSSNFLPLPPFKVSYPAKNF